MNKFQKLAVPGVQKLHPYQPGKPVEELERELGISNAIKLASNENPLGPSLKAVEAGRRIIDEVNFYPDGSGHKLSKALADVCGVDINCITLGNGSNDILELIGRAFLSTNTSAVYSEYSFAVYPLVVQAIGAKARVAEALPVDHEVMPYGHDLDAIAALITDDTRVVFIANPNNPTGTWFGVDELYGFLNKVPGDTLVVLDQAYFEYMSDDLQPETVDLLAKFPNIIITRTFSKIYGLAGLRIGYSISHPDIADMLNRVRQPFNTNMIAQEAALAALDDQQHIQNSVSVNNKGLEQYRSAFEDMGLSYIPSIANFISVNVKQDAAPIYDALLKRGVIVRPVASYKMPEFLRITVGNQEQNSRVLEALKQVLS